MIEPYTNPDLKPANHEDELAVRYWGLVHDCLIHFHGLDEADASERVLDLRTRLNSYEPHREFPAIYNTEPYEVACNLFGIQSGKKRFNLYQHDREAYERLRANR